jgi:hypothetical protein
MNWESASRGFAFGAADFRAPFDRNPATSNRSACTAIVAVDGVPHFYGRPEASIERLVPLSEVRALEIFSDPNFTPRELDFARRMNPLDVDPWNPVPCGVVAIWTAEGLDLP